MSDKIPAPPRRVHSVLKNGREMMVPTGMSLEEYQKAYEEWKQKLFDTMTPEEWAEYWRLESERKARKP